MRKTGPVYCFGHFQLDAGEQVLFCDASPLHLSPKALLVLQVLLENAGHVVEKDEALQLCWPDSFVEEANLAQTIFVLRQTLGECGDHLEYIQTVHRRGYRFVVPVLVKEPLGTSF